MTNVRTWLLGEALLLMFVEAALFVVVALVHNMLALILYGLVSLLISGVLAGQLYHYARDEIAPPMSTEPIDTQQLYPGFG